MKGHTPSLRGWRYGVFLGGLVGMIGLAVYPAIISPMLNPEPWKAIQKETRANIEKEKVQPGGMKVWSDPFDRRK